MYSLVLSSSGVWAVAGVFAEVDVFVCAADSAPGVRHMTRNTASTIARIVILLIFHRERVQNLLLAWKKMKRGKHYTRHSNRVKLLSYLPLLFMGSYLQGLTPHQ